MHRKINKSLGISLIEVLIALLVTSVGIMGLLSMQVSTSQQVQTTRYLQTANQALVDLANHITNNKTQALNGEFDFTNLSSGTAPTASVNCKQTTCTSPQIAAYELNQWFSGISQTLPSPRFSVVSKTAVNGKQITILLIWDPTLKGGSGVCGADGVDHQCVSITLWVG